MQLRKKVSLALVAFVVELGVALVLLNSCASDNAAQARSGAATPGAAPTAKPYYRAKGTGPAVWGSGDLYTFLATGEETDGAYFMLEGVVPPGGGPPPHIHHTEAESFYLVNGTLQMHMGDSTVMASAGDFVSVPKGTPHSFKNVGNTNATMILTFVPAGVEGFFKEAMVKAEDRTATPPPLTPEQIQKMVEVGPKYNLEILPPPAAK